MDESLADSNQQIQHVNDGDHGEHVERVYKYLRRFGYLPNDELTEKYPSWSPAVESAPSDPTRFEGQLQAAVRVFQRAYGLEETGRVDQATAELMNRPRCGVPDNVSMHGLFVAEGSKWPRHNLTYTHVNFTADLNQQDARAAIRGAFDRWTQVSPLNFSEQADGDIQIGFYSGNHGDGDSNAFDGAGKVLAHCFYPPPSGGQLAGDCHFDEDETWSDNLPATGTDLPSVALHELGHGVGLDHSAVASAVMYAFYSGPRRDLTDDDIQGIQSIYGIRFPDWQLLDGNPATAAIVADANSLYQLHRDGKIWRYTGTPMTGWQLLDGNPATASIVAAGGNLYQLHRDGKIWRYTGTPMTGWQLLDGNPATASVVAAGNHLYQLHRDGKIWRYTGTPMTGWQLLDGNPATASIVAAGGNLYQLHRDGKIWRYTGTPMTGWQLLDGNPATASIVAAGGNLYQLHRDGKIWRYTGTPMTGWQLLDNNQSTAGIVAGGDRLYQIHKNGWIWRYTGTPMTGWQQLDNNAASQVLCASENHLYQKHIDGKIWRYTK